MLNNQTTLLWSTETELNNLYFDIESARGENGFSSIGRVEGALSSQTKRDYTFIDIHPLKGINYYRLKQVDLDGASTYSKIISFFFNPENNVVIFPNPATNTLNVIFNKDATSQSRIDYSVANKGIEIRIFDYLGKLIKTWNALNNTKPTSFDITDISSGQYVVELQFENQMERYKIVKY